ncbi:hypothetical protein [Campylobacter sp. RM12651]|uniref:hypothetical protein n=1 Tax=Campylobacter sp. RM12651 TaxID=1660079 RepID=UPI001EFAC6FE|nr:hypothetical protein [Campylobacter sp. RM12651]ULO03769.1 putative membrane protein [Campylobacter sp. RM12651]
MAKSNIKTIYMISVIATAFVVLILSGYTMGAGNIVLAWLKSKEAFWVAAIGLCVVSFYCYLTEKFAWAFGSLIVIVLLAFNCFVFVGA